MKRTHIAGLSSVLIVLAIAVAGLLHRGAQDVPADLVLLHDGEQIELSLEDLQPHRKLSPMMRKGHCIRRGSLPPQGY